MTSSASEQWSCRICGRINESEQSACWSCQSPRLQNEGEEERGEKNRMVDGCDNRAARVPRRTLLVGGLAGVGALCIGGFLWYTHMPGNALAPSSAPFISPYLTWSPQLTYVAITEADANAHNSRLEIRDGRTQQLISAFRAGGDIYWSPDETRVLLAGKSADIWRVTDGKQVGQIEFDEIPNTVAWSPHLERIATANLGKVQTWSIIDGKRLFTHTLPAASSDPPADADPIALAWSPDNRFLAFAGGLWSRQGYGMMGVIGGIWDADDPGRVRDISAALQKGKTGVDRGALAWSPDGAHIAVGDADVLGILNVSDASMTSLIKRDLASLAWPVAWSPNGKFLAVWRKSTIEVWRIADSRMVQSIQSGLHGLPALAWTADGSQIMAVDNSRKIRSWKVK